MEAIQEVIQGKCVDLGGGVFKKRLNENKHRSIILAKSCNYWVYEFLFAKNKMDNIGNDELVEFKNLAKAYANLSEAQVAKLLKNKDWVDISDEYKKQVQK